MTRGDIKASGARIGLLALEVYLIDRQLRLAGDTFAGVVRGNWREVGLALLLLALAALAFTAAAFVTWKCFPWKHHQAAMLGVLLVVEAGGYAFTQRSLIAAHPLPDFFGATVVEPNTKGPDNAPGRPFVIYETNSHGFRKPEWTLEKPAGSLRGVLIGDSYVFGSGVEADQTLSAHLEKSLKGAFPQCTWEVLNLGIPGAGFPTYHKLLRATFKHLNPDFVALCLTLPNDLTTWDGGSERLDALSYGPYSLCMYLFGQAVPGMVWNWWLQTRSMGPHEQEELQREFTKVFAERPLKSRPLLVLFSFFPVDKIFEGLSREPGLIPVMPLPSNPEHFIPGDGHPTGAGNTAFGARITETLALAPEFQGLIGQETLP